MADNRVYREYTATVNGEKVTISLCSQNVLNMNDWNKIWSSNVQAQQGFLLLNVAAKTIKDKTNIGKLNLRQVNKIVEKWNEDCANEVVEED